MFGRARFSMAFSNARPESKTISVICLSSMLFQLESEPWFSYPSDVCTVWAGKKFKIRITPFSTMLGLLVDKDLLIGLAVDLFSAKERRGVQLFCSVLYIRKRWGKVGKFGIRKKNMESFAETWRALLSMRTDDGSMDLLGVGQARIEHCLTWPSCKGLAAWQ